MDPVAEQLHEIVQRLEKFSQDLANLGLGENGVLTRVSVHGTKKALLEAAMKSKYPFGFDSVERTHTYWMEYQITPLTSLTLFYEPTEFPELK